MSKTVELYDYNQKIYNQFSEMLEQNNKLLLESASGTGKSFIMMKYVESHPNITVIVCPRNDIKEQWYGFAEEYELPIFPTTYQTLYQKTEKELYELGDFCHCFVFDEAHHMGAAHWHKNIDWLMEHFQTSTYIGLTATPIRYTDGYRNMADEYFNGNLLTGITQEEAIKQKILPKFKYVCGLFADAADIKEYRQKAEETKLNKQDVLYKKINRLEYCIENQKEVHKAFDKYLPNDNRKGIVFVDTIENIDHACEIMYEYFGDGYGYYTEHSHKSPLYNLCSQEEFFRADKAWMFVVGMYNEGVHSPGVNTIVMFRKTASPTLFKQQLGRSQSAGMTSDPIVFDFVGNHVNLKSFNSEPFNNTINFHNEKDLHDEEEALLIADTYEMESIKLLNEIDDLLIGWRPWTEEEDQFLKDNYLKYGSQYCAEHLDRTANACISEANKLKISGIDYWTEEEEQFLKDNYSKYGLKYCAEHLNREYKACQGRARKLKLTNTQRYWTEEEIQFLKDNYPKYGSQYCAEHLGRSIGACDAEAHKLKIYTINYWTEEEDQFLKDNYPKYGPQYCSEHLDRSIGACKSEAQKLGINHIKRKKNFNDTCYWTEEEEQFLKDNYSKYGRKYCAEHLNRGYKSCQGKARKLKLTTNTQRYWTEEEIQFLKDNYPKYGSQYCAEHLGRTKSACQGEVQRQKITTHINYWTEEEDQFLKDNYPKYGPQYCSEHLDRSIGACKSEAQKLYIYFDNSHTLIFKRKHKIEPNKP